MEIVNNLYEQSQEGRQTYYDHIRRRWQTLLLYGVIAMAFITGVSFFLPLEYRANTQVFILPRSTVELDSYTSVKSGERLGENLTRLVKTTSFLELVILAGRDNIELTYFPKDLKQRSRAWKRMIKAEVVPGTGLLRIAIYHKNKEQARLILQAVADVLATRGGSYTGFDVDIKQVDSIFLTDLPVRPNILANAFLGFLLGIIISGVYVVVEGERMLRI